MHIFYRLFQKLIVIIRYNWKLAYKLNLRIFHIAQVVENQQKLQLSGSLFLLLCNKMTKPQNGEANSSSCSSHLQSMLRFLHNFHIYSLTCFFLWPLPFSDENWNIHKGEHKIAFFCFMRTRNNWKIQRATAIYCGNKNVSNLFQN